MDEQHIKTNHPAPLPAGKSPAALPATPWTWRAALAVAVVALATVACPAPTALTPRGQAALGVLCFIGTAAVFSANLRAINWHTIGWGFALQVLLVLFVLKVGYTRVTPPAQIDLFHTHQAVAVFGAGSLGPFPT